jgi:uncharacterized protein
MIDRACISINSKCNLSCSYCHFGKNVNPLEKDSWDINEDEIKKLLKNIIDYVQIKELKHFKIGIVGSGEPMLNFIAIKSIIDYVKVNSITNLSFYIITNGTLLSADQLDYFFQMKDYITLNFSLDGFKALHEMSRPHYDITMKNIVAYEEKFGYKPIINMVVSKNTIMHQEELINYLISNRFNKVNFSIAFVAFVEKISITRDEYNTFLNECMEKGIMSRQMTKEVKYDCTKYGNLCGVGITNIYFTKYGVYPCGRFQGHLDHKIGDLSDNLFMIEKKLSRYELADRTHCYYEYYEVGKK